VVPLLGPGPASTKKECDAEVFGNGTLAAAKPLGPDSTKGDMLLGPLTGTTIVVPCERNVDCKVMVVHEEPSQETVT
jgi:hypothetical protein